MVVSGVLTILASFFIQRAYKKMAVSSSISLFGVGVLGVGIFNGSYGSIHAMFAILAFLMGGLAGCTGIKMITEISEKGFKVDSFTMRIDGTKSKTPPGLFEKLHLVISLSGNMDEGTAAEAIENTIMRTCPVAALFRKTVEITWEYHLTK